jgi:hypothetical protein
MIEIEVPGMKINKPVAVMRRPQSKRPHIPREMPLIYQVLEDFEEGVKLPKMAVYQRLH